MRSPLPAAVLALVAVAHAAEGDGSPYLLKAGESPRKGWSVLVFQTESVFSGGRVKVGNSDTCSSVDTAPCHFAVPDGPAAILIDQALEYGDTTATLTASGQRVYVIKSIQNTGRAAARAFGGLLGAALTQPDDPPPGAAAPAAKPPEAGPLTNLRKGSRFDMEFVSMSEPGKAGEFVAPQEK
jgi:hypothetical protein